MILLSGPAGLIDILIMAGLWIGLPFLIIFPTFVLIKYQLKERKKINASK
jgi:hypothetical protein